MHGHTVSKVIQQAREIKAWFDKDKLQYEQIEVRYVGQIFNEQGMSVDT